MSPDFWLGVAITIANAALWYRIGKRAGREEAHRAVSLNPSPRREWP